MKWREQEERIRWVTAVARTLTVFALIATLLSARVPEFLFLALVLFVSAARAGRRLERLHREAGWPPKGQA